MPTFSTAQSRILCNYASIELSPKLQQNFFWVSLWSNLHNENLASKNKDLFYLLLSVVLFC